MNEQEKMDLISLLEKQNTAPAILFRYSTDFFLLSLQKLNQKYWV
jgi:hypothetical protein